MPARRIVPSTILSLIHISAVKPAEVVAPVVPEPPKKEVPPVVVTPPKSTVKKAEVEEQDKPKVKVVGKIDLTPKVPETKPVVEEKPVVVEPVKEVVEAPPVAPVVPEKEVDKLVRAEAPQLQGLKIMGKIDTQKDVYKRQE